VDLTSALSVLVVEDDVDLSEILEDVVSELGYKPIVAAGGKAALTVLASRHVDIIISDMNMPHMSGVDLLHAVRDRGYKIPFIIQSGSSSAETYRELEALGLFDFLLKPASFETIQAALSKAAAAVNKS